MQLYLRENTATNKPQASQVAKPSQHPQTKYDPTSGKPICGRFNIQHLGVHCAAANLPTIDVHALSHTAILPTTLSSPLPPPPTHPLLKKNSGEALTSPCPPFPHCSRTWPHGKLFSTMTLIGTSFSMVSEQDFHWSTLILMLLTFPPTSTPKSKSSQLPNTKHRLESQIAEELVCGHYVWCNTHPTIVSAVSAIPKPDGSLQLIHDMSRPESQGVNAYASKDPCKYQTIDEILCTFRLHPGYFMAVVELKSAYRSVHIKPKQHCITGLRWWFSGDENATMMCDTRLPFGCRKSPWILNWITQAVVLVMNFRGYDTLAYLDDFIVTGSDFHSCKAALDAFIILLRSLGFQINWAKILDPSQSVTFLGVNIDSAAGELSLKPDKLHGVLAIIRDFQRRHSASRKQLECLAGKLIWASHVTPWGRSHVKSVYSLISTSSSLGTKGSWFPSNGT